MGTAPSPPSVDLFCDALEDATARLAAMLRLNPDPSVPAIGVWTIGETACHLSASPIYFLAAARHELHEPEALGDVAEGNAEHLEADPERDPRVLADRLERADRALVAYARSVRGDPPAEPFAGVEVPLSSVLAVELGELLVHGYDIGHAARLPWGIHRQEAALTLTGLVPLLPHMVDGERARGATMRCELRIRGGGRAVLALEHGALRLEPPGSRTLDCRMSVDPAAFLLLSYRRIGMLGPILRGRLVTWGRRPWRAGKLQTVMKAV